jgi:hypothetical protein
MRDEVIFACVQKYHIHYDEKAASQQVYPKKLHHIAGAGISQQAGIGAVNKVKSTTDKNCNAKNNNKFYVVKRSWIAEKDTKKHRQRSGKADNKQVDE